MSEPSVTVLFLAHDLGDAAAWGRQFLAPQSYARERLRFLAAVPGPTGVPAGAGGEGWEVVVGQGHAAADINRAAVTVDTPYLVLADGSLAPESDWIRPLVREAERSSRIVATAPKILAPGNVIAAVGAGMAADYRWHDRGSGEVDTGRYDGNRELYANTLLGSCLDRRRLLEAGGLAEVFRTSYADIDLSIRWIQQGYRMRYVPEAVVQRAAGAPGADRNPEPPEPAAEWERLTLIARQFPDLLPARIATAGVTLAGADDAADRLATVLAHWAPTREDAGARQRLHRRLLENPGASPGLLMEAWENSSGG